MDFRPRWVQRAVGEKILEEMGWKEQVVSRECDAGNREHGGDMVQVMTRLVVYSWSNWLRNRE